MKTSKHLLILLVGGVGLCSANAQPDASISKATTPDTPGRTVQPAVSPAKAPGHPFTDALKRDFLGRRGRDMFDGGGSIRRERSAEDTHPAITHRTVGGGSKHDLLGKVGRDMFDIGGALLKPPAS